MPSIIIRTIGVAILVGAYGLSLHGLYHVICDRAVQRNHHVNMVRERIAISNVRHRAVRIGLIMGLFWGLLVAGVVAEELIHVLLSGFILYDALLDYRDRRLMWAFVMGRMTAEGVPAIPHRRVEDTKSEAS